MIILGISCFYHDSAAAIIKDGEIIVASEEERFTRKKHDRNFPLKSIQFCLEESGITLDDVDAIVFYDKPLLKFDRILETFFAFAPRGMIHFLKAIPLWIREKIFFKKLILDSLARISSIKKPIFFSEHHLSHAASAFYPSPFEKAAILCIDGVGEWASSSGWVGNANSITPLFEIEFPHSLGLFYSAFTGFLGFKVNSGEYKLMGLAPFGEPIFADLILKECILLLEDGSFQLNLKYFDFISNDKMYTDELEKLFAIKSKKTNEKFEQIHFDIASSVQFVLEKAILGLVKKLNELAPLDSIVLSGGVALNCVANSKIMKSHYFSKIWIQPAAGDSGGAIGAALAFYFLEKKQTRTCVENAMKGALLGPSFNNDVIKTLLDKLGAQYYFNDNIHLIDNLIVDELSKGKVVGLFRGKMEFGPRALGSRSIIADPRVADMRSILNLKVKKRESFRPFAPAVLKEHVDSYFDWSKDESSPYMLFVSKSLRPNEIPSVSHLDASSRIQIVDKNIHSSFHSLLECFYNKTNCPVLINTSFNVRGEPIVMSPYDAINCFMTTDIDVLAIENFILLKQNQSQQLVSNNWRSQFEED